MISKKVIKFTLSIGFLMLLSFSFSSDNDLGSVYINAIKLYNQKRYFEAFKLLDSVVVSQTNVSPQFYAKSIDALIKSISLENISFSEAKKELKKYLEIIKKRNVTNTHVLENLALGFLDLNDNITSANICLEIIFHEVSNENAIFMLSVNLFRLREYELALNISHKLLHIDRFLVDILYILSLSSMYVPDFRKVRTLDFSRVLLASHTDQNIGYTYATIYYEMFDFDKALKCLEHSKNFDNELLLKIYVARREYDKIDKSLINNAEGDIKTVYEYLVSGNKQKFFEFLENNVKRMKYEEPYLIELGISLLPDNSKLKKELIRKKVIKFFSQKLYDEVIEILTKQSTISKEEIYILLSSYIMSNKKNELRKFLERFGKNHIDELSLIHAYFTLGDYDNLRKIINRVDIRKVSNTEKVLLLHILLEIGEINKALEVYNLISEESVGKYKELSSAYIDFYRKDYKNSLDKIKKLLEENPFDIEILNNFAYISAINEENLEDSLKAAYFANFVDTSNYVYLDTLGYVKYKKGLLDEARKDIDESIKLMEEFGERNYTVYMHAGDVYFALGQVRKALEFYKTSLKILKSINPNSYDVEYLTTRIRNLSINK